MTSPSLAKFMAGWILLKSAIPSSSTVIMPPMQGIVSKHTKTIINVFNVSMLMPPKFKAS